MIKFRHPSQAPHFVLVKRCFSNRFQLYSPQVNPLIDLSGPGLCEKRAGPVSRTKSIYFTPSLISSLCGKRGKASVLVIVFATALKGRPPLFLSYSDLYIGYFVSNYTSIIHPLMSLVVDNVIPLLIGSSTRASITSNVYHMGEGSRPCSFPVKGNGHKRGPLPM